MHVETHSKSAREVIDDVNLHHVPMTTQSVASLNLQTKKTKVKRIIV